MAGGSRQAAGVRGRLLPHGVSACSRSARRRVSGDCARGVPSAAGGETRVKTREKFDLLETEIANDAMLIEASAGTGKTFTISFLVLRLLLERPELTIDRILVTTFTELATADLRGRIRERLRDAL